MVALSNGNISFGDLDLFNNKGKSKESNKNKLNKERTVKDKKSKTRNKNFINSDISDLFKFNMDDLNRGIKMMDLSEEDLERGMEIITRTKKYMSSDERKILIITDC